MAANWESHPTTQIDVGHLGPNICEWHGSVCVRAGREGTRGPNPVDGAGVMQIGAGVMQNGAGVTQIGAGVMQIGAGGGVTAMFEDQDCLRSYGYT